MNGRGLDMPAQYRIGQFADLSGVSAKTLRFYDEIGLLRPACTDPRTRYRLYLPRQLEELASILALKDLGVSLADIRNLTSKPVSKRDRRELLNDLKKTVEQSIQTATQSLNWINGALNELDAFQSSIPIVVKRRPAVPIASIRAKVQNYAEIERFEQELLSALPARSMSRLRGVLWHRCADSGCLEGEAFVALNRSVPARGVFDLKQLSPATLACAYSESDEDSAELVYSAIRRWLNIRGYRLAGPKREVYVDGLLEIQFPLKSA
jgi:DNA-binding transcriptional MerR regulator